VARIRAPRNDELVQAVAKDLHISEEQARSRLWRERGLVMSVARFARRGIAVWVRGGDAEIPICPRCRAVEISYREHQFGDVCSSCKDAVVGEEVREEERVRGAREVVALFDSMWESGDWDGQVSLGFASSFAAESSYWTHPVEAGVVPSYVREAGYKDGYKDGMDDARRAWGKVSELLELYRDRRGRWDSEITPEMREKTWERGGGGQEGREMIAVHIYGHVIDELEDVRGLLRGRDV